MKKVIFDLDGTLALIDKRRAISIKDNGKMDWDTFFDPANIQLDKPNWPVIHMARLLKKDGHRIVIFSGRSKATKDATRDWLNDLDIPFDVLVKELKVERSLSVNPFFQAMFLYHSVPENPFFPSL